MIVNGCKVRKQLLERDIEKIDRIYMRQDGKHVSWRSNITVR